MYLVTYDIGNSFIKATLTKIANSIEFVGATVVSTHSTSTLGGKGVEQSTEQTSSKITVLLATRSRVSVSVPK